MLKGWFHSDRKNSVQAVFLLTFYYLHCTFSSLAVPSVGLGHLFLFTCPRSLSCQAHDLSLQAVSTAQVSSHCLLRTSAVFHVLISSSISGF